MIPLQIGESLTKGRGTGGSLELGESAAQADEEKIRSAMKGADLVFVTAGMGGGAGTGAAPVVAKIARDLGILTIGVVTVPFSFEGARKKRLANEGIVKMQANMDALIAVHNDNLMMRPQEIDGKMFFCTISAGTVFYPQAGKDYLVLHKHAEAALDLAKQSGKNKNCLFSKAQYNRWVRSISMRDDLRDSVEQGCRGFSLFFQPQVSARGQKLIGAEALLRWMNPKGRMLLFSPYLLYDTSFQLSFLATAGLLYLSPALAVWLEKYLPPWIAGSLAVTIGAQLSVLPLLAWYFHRVSVSALLANMLAVPLVEAIIVLGLFAGIAGWLLPFLSQLIFMVDAVNAKDVKRALQLLQRQIDDGVYMPLILGLLVRQVRQLWQIKTLMAKGLRGRQLAGPLELNPFIAEKASKASHEQVPHRGGGGAGAHFPGKHPGHRAAHPAGPAVPDLCVFPGAHHLCGQGIQPEAGPFGLQRDGDR